MARQYTAEELLVLRESPLVYKPDGLPPIEEWMGSPPERTQVKPLMGRGKTDDTSYSEATHRRPTLSDARHVSRTSGTVPEDIILGPPKTSFASATKARTSNKSVDLQERSGYGIPDDDSPRQDRYNGREGHFKDKDRRGGMANARRGTIEDEDGWTSVKPRKSFGHEDAERFNRRHIDREKHRDLEPRREGGFSRNNDIENRDRDRDRDRDNDREGGMRKNGYGRARNEPSWFRDDNNSGPKEREYQKPPQREERGWRDRDRWTDRSERNDRNERADRGWARGAHVEQEPEWMDSPEREEKKQARTAEDFERWKERMKAGNANDEGQKEAEPNSRQRSMSGVTKDEPQPQKSHTPLVVDPSTDAFFGLWTQPKPTSEVPIVEASGPSAVRKDSGKFNGGKASRFTSFFSPQEELPRREFESPVPKQPDASNEDREGFQRILQMLGGANIGSGASTPSLNIMQQPTPPVNEPQKPAITRNLSNSADVQRNPRSQARSQNLGGLESLLSSQTPPVTGTPDPNSEFLLKLMQQTHSQSGQPQSQSRQGNPGLFHMVRPGNDMKEDRKGRDHPSALFDETNLIGMPSKSPEAMEAPQGLRKARMGGRPPGFFDEPGLAAEMQQHQSPTDTPSEPPRPPGFEQMGWPNHMPPPPHPSQMPPPQSIPPPPGFNGMPPPPSRGFPPGFIPNMPVFGPRGVPQDMPPGPPPMFAGMGGIPPGFGPLGFSPDGMMGPGQPRTPRGDGRAPGFPDMFGGEPWPAGRGLPPGQPGQQRRHE